MSICYIVPACALCEIMQVSGRLSFEWGTFGWTEKERGREKSKGKRRDRLQIKIPSRLRSTLNALPVLQMFDDQIRAAMCAVLASDAMLCDVVVEF